MVTEMETSSLELQETESNAEEVTKQKKKYRFKPGTKSLREIKKHQNTTTHLIQRKPFRRLVKEIACTDNKSFKFEKRAIDALQDDAENFVTQYFARTQKNAIHAGRKTILVQDGKM